MAQVESIKILLVDDSQAVAGLYQQMLESYGYRVVTANSGTEALEVAEREQPEIGLLDFHLPDFTGDELARRLLANPRTAHIVISMLSSYSDVTRSSLDAGAIDMITKDTPEELFLLRIEALERKVLIERESQWNRKHGSSHSSEEMIPFKVLLVDDSRFVRSAYQAILEESECEVLIAENMREALEVARAERPDLAIVDFYMKGGNGDELTRALLNDPITQNVLVVILTSQMEVKDIALASGAVDVINKGEQQATFIQRIASIREYRRQVSRQILRHMRSAQEAERLHQWVSSILSSMRDPVLVVESGGVVIHANPASERLIGISTEKIVGQKFNQLLVEEVASDEHTYTYLNTDQTLRCAKGKRVPVHISGALLSNSHQDQTLIEGAVLVIYDLSQRLKEQEHQQYLAFQSGIAEMSASILHNIGNTLSGLGGRVASIHYKMEELKRLEQLMNRISESDEVDEAAAREALKVSADAISKVTGQDGIEAELGKIDQSIRTIERTISVHRSASKSDLSSSSFHLKDLVEDLLFLLKEGGEERAIKITTHFNLPADRHVEMPKNQAMQMVLNLVQNSFESIQQRARYEKDGSWRGEISISVLMGEGGRPQLTIEDNGVGIDESQRPHLFTQGYTTKPGGSGFGLHSVGGFVQSIGAKLELLSSGKDRGAMAIIIF